METNLSKIHRNSNEMRRYHNQKGKTKSRKWNRKRIWKHTKSIFGSLEAYEPYHCPRVVFVISSSKFSLSIFYSVAFCQLMIASNVYNKLMAYIFDDVVCACVTVWFCRSKQNRQFGWEIRSSCKILRQIHKHMKIAKSFAQFSYRWHVFKLRIYMEKNKYCQSLLQVRIYVVNYCRMWPFNSYIFFSFHCVSVSPFFSFGLGSLACSLCSQSKSDN